MRLKGRVALVTGASRGIGRGIAIAFGREGAKVAVNYHTSREAAEETASLIRERGGEAETYQGDVADRDRMAEIVREIVGRFGRLDVYVNNANAGASASWETTAYLNASEDQLFEGFYRSFKAAYVNGQLAARQMIAQGGGGRIINITSVHQERAWPEDSVYGSMKAAVRRLTMSQAVELAPHGILVNCVAPGFVDVRAHEGERGEWYDRENERAAREVPLGRGLPADVAEAVVYLASDDARYLTGTCILVDGGMLLPPVTTV